MKKNLLFCLFAITFVLFFRCNCNSVSQIIVTNDDEIQMGKNFAKQIESDTENFPLYKNKRGKKQELIDYIDSLGRHLVKTMGESNYGRDTLPYQFTIIDADTVINAFAVPGGFVYIYTGLIIAAANEAEIAGVLAHEIAHITKRHGVKRLIQGASAGFILDLIAGDSTILRTVLDVSAGMLFLKYSRDDEYEADSCAVEYLIKAGYNPTGMWSFLKFLKEQNESRWCFEAFSTHPETGKRMKAVENLINTKDQNEINKLRTPEKKNIIP